MSDANGPSGLVLALLPAGEAGARARRSGANPGWDEGVTVRIGERWLRLVRQEVRERSRRRVHAYVLEDLPPGQVIRGPVVSDVRLPASLGDPPPDPGWDPYRS